MVTRVLGACLSASFSLRKRSSSARRSSSAIGNDLKSYGLKARDWSWLQATELGSNCNYAYYACADNSQRNPLQHHEQTQSK
jgi:hypothetical protein